MGDFPRAAENVPAAARDDAADARDVAAQARDEAADQRDIDAGARDHFYRHLQHDFTDRLGAIAQDLLHRLTRNEDLAVDPDDWPDAGATALARLRACAEKRRQLAAEDRAVAAAMLEEIHNELRLQQEGWRAARRDRDAAADDRRNARRDRDSSMRDRNHAAIEREQVDPADLPQDHGPPAGDDDRIDRMAARIARLRQQFLDAYTSHSQARDGHDRDDEAGGDG
jgi:hypothetical protein